jgi:nicotinamidase-related amidase
MESKELAVLVLDMNKDHIRNNNPYNSERLRNKISTIKVFLEKTRKYGIPIVYVSDSHRLNDWIFSRSNIKPYAIEGTYGEEIIEELTPNSNDYIIRKRRFSGFYGTDLDLYLRELGIKSLLLLGGPTHVSIRYTAVDAYSKRYRVFIIMDCTDSPTKGLFESAIEDMFFTIRLNSKKFFTKYLRKFNLE